LTPSPEKAPYEGREDAEAEDPPGAKKRFKITGSGKLKKQQAGMRHNLEHKSSRRTRRLNQDQVLSKADTKVAKKLLGR
jgi:large subunit ribosomal protein L35